MTGRIGLGIGVAMSVGVGVAMSAGIGVAMSVACFGSGGAQVGSQGRKPLERKRPSR